jgi:small subunit ribosomal protein S1
VTGKSGFPKIEWEDDDAGFGKKEDADGKDEQSDEFGSLLASSTKKSVRFLVGEKIKGIIASIPSGDGDVLVDVGTNKSAGVMTRYELCDEQGALQHKVGDEIEAFVLSMKGGEIQLSFKNTQALKSIADLEAAFAQRMPVKGRVAKAIKGGFEVTVLGKPAFCPVSQIDSRFVENTAEYVGKDFDFIVEKLERGGRNIVVSRSALLKARAEERTKELLASLRPDTVLDGVVKELRDFGAFVDIGGVDGMVHVSEITHARVAKPGDVLSVGEKVRVKVLKIEPSQAGKPKISLSIKAAMTDPWDEIDQHVEGGASYTGKVVNLMPFGAFVELKPGIEGLIHVSEMSWTKRVHHPSDVVKVGDVVSVLVKEIDRRSRRIALSMKQLEQDPWFGAAERFPVGKTLMAPVEKLKPFGAIVTLGDGITGMLPITIIKKKFGEAFRAQVAPPKEVEVRIQAVDLRERKIQLSLAGIEGDEDGTQDYKEYLKAEAAAREQAAREVESASSSAGKMGALGALLQAKLSEKKAGR